MPFLSRGSEVGGQDQLKENLKSLSEICAGCVQFSYDSKSRRNTSIANRCRQFLHLFVC